MRLIQQAARKTWPSLPLKSLLLLLGGQTLLLLLLLLLMPHGGAGNQVAMQVSPHNNPNRGHQERSKSDTSKPKVDVAALATNPLDPQTLPLGHPNPFGGIEISRRPQAGLDVASAQLQTAPSGGGDCSSLGRGQTSSPRDSPPTETKDATAGRWSSAGVSATEAEPTRMTHMATGRGPATRDMIDGSPIAPGDNAPTGPQHQHQRLRSHRKRTADNSGGLPVMGPQTQALLADPSKGVETARGINAPPGARRAQVDEQEDDSSPADSSPIGSDELQQQQQRKHREQLAKVIHSFADESGAELVPDQQPDSNGSAQSAPTTGSSSTASPTGTTPTETSVITTTATEAATTTDITAGRIPKLKCRVEKDLYLEFEEYQHYTCAHCYNQVPPEYFNNKLGLVRPQEGRMIRLRDRESEEALWTNETARIKQTFKVEEKFEKWQICCRQAVECCLENAKYLPTISDHRQSEVALVDDPRRNECPGTWDGLSCWGPSAAGRLAWRECPRVAYLLDFEPACRGYVTKQCFQNASWFINRNGHEWSDYSGCSPEGLYKARMLHASVAYVCEALIVMPALLIIGKFPGRGGNKRIRIMKSLLFYILLNSLIQALQRGFLAAGYFAEYRGGPTRVEHHSSSRQQLHQSQQDQRQQQQQQQQQRQQQHREQRDQSAVPTKLALISTMDRLHSANEAEAARNELILSAISPKSLPGRASDDTGGDSDEAGRLKQRQRRHAPSAGSWEMNTTLATPAAASAATGAQRDNEQDDGADKYDVFRAEPEHSQLKGGGGPNSNSNSDSDDDDDDKESELVARIFSTAPQRQLGPSFRGLYGDGGYHAQIDKSNWRLEADQRAPSSSRPPSWLELIATTGRSFWNNIDGKQAAIVSDGHTNQHHISSKYQLTAPFEADSIKVTPTTDTPIMVHDHDLGRPLDTQHVPNKLAVEKSLTTTNQTSAAGASSRRIKRYSSAAAASAATTNDNSRPEQRFQPQIARLKRKESVWKAFFCWFLQMSGRLVRLMCYNWMFAGGVYLCAALHYAPAEPPLIFIRVLFFLTNAIPVLIFFAYVTARTINEPSPLNIIIKAPYYWFQREEDQIEQLHATQTVCWFEESKSPFIENIADWPNLILVCCNVLLFVYTLVTISRINRPGSTRPETSPCANFKAAGTLLFLYGGHYFFLAYRPESESCSVDTFMFYAFICIDVVQGIAISFVFCYLTQEGKSVIKKYWMNNRFTPFRQLRWMSCFSDDYKLADNGYHHNNAHNNIRPHHSLRSNTSGCNGHNDNVTELVTLNDTQASSHF